MPLPTDHPNYGERILQMGAAKGLDIWNLQVKLIGWGSGSDNDGIGNTMDPVHLTGEFDCTTRDAVMRFQKSHRLPITGIVDARVFRAIDAEAALHPVLMFDLRCPCASKKNDGPIPCRCTKHEDDGKAGVCDGYGKKRFAGKFIVEGIKLADDSTDLSTEKLDVYDKQEYEGMDKTVLWAVRAIMCRARTSADDATTALQPVTVKSGYRCWIDNYHNTDETRWHHRRLTFHFGKAIEFIHPDPHTTTGTTACAGCQTIRDVALNKCGFQLRWQEPGRPSVAEVAVEARPPASAFSVHVDTVRLHPRKDDGALDYDDDGLKKVFVKTDADAVKPLFGDGLAGVSFPLVLDRAVTDDCPEPDLAGALTGAVAGLSDKVLKVRRALDPRFTSAEDFFRNTETGKGGWFPVGRSRTWHGGIHVYGDAGTPVHAIADGEIVGGRVGDAEEQDNGSTNFVLVRHTVKLKDPWKDKVFYSLYMHLDAETAKVDAAVRWRRELFKRSKLHVEATIPAPIYEVKLVDGKNRLLPKPGLVAGETREAKGAEVESKTKDDRMPDGWMIVELVTPADHFFFTKREGQDMGTLVPALAGVDGTDVIGLEKPIFVSAGEILGKIGKAATKSPVKDMGAFLHLETFAEAELPIDGVIKVDASAAAKIADRKSTIAALTDDSVQLLPKAQDGVMTTAELEFIFGNAPFHTRLRSAQIKMPNAWSVDWKKALKDAKSYGFVDDTDPAGTAWNLYNWWEKVKTGKGKLPADATAIFHYHPIALIMQLAYA